MTEREIQEQPQTYTKDDLLQFDNVNRYSSFGNSNQFLYSYFKIVLLSNKPTAPRPKVSQASRYAEVYQNREMAKAQFAGKQSPGPIYNTRDTDKYQYNQSVQVKIGRQRRNTMDGPHYDYYERKDIDYEPHQANDMRRQHNTTVRFGLEQRFNKQNRRNNTPGPQYDAQKVNKKAPSYTIGSRRGKSVLSDNGSTPVIVGPGAYLNGDKLPKTSEIANEPLYSFTQGPKFGNYINKWDRNQTYDTQQQVVDFDKVFLIRPSIGNQVNSRKRSGSAYSIGRAKRDYNVGYFKDQMMKQPKPVRISHPKF